MPVRLCPPEEVLWQKCFIMERERFDGADVAHLLRSCAAMLDWPRLIERFGQDWRVLLPHLILFGFIYPSKRSLIPVGVMAQLMEKLLRETELPDEEDKRCNGTLLSRAQYLPDVERWGFADPASKSEISSLRNIWRYGPMRSKIRMPKKENVAVATWEDRFRGSSRMAQGKT